MSTAEKKSPLTEGPEIGIVQIGVPCGLFQKRTEPGYMLADGTVLLESERDAHGCYKGGAGMDGMYLQTGRLYAPVRGEDGQIRAFHEMKGVNESHKPSVLDSLRQCQKAAEETKDRAVSSDRGPER